MGSCHCPELGPKVGCRQGQNLYTPRGTLTWWTFQIYIFFLFLLGGGEGGFRCARRGGLSFFCWKVPGGGGCLRRGGRGEGPGGCLWGILGGGGANFFFFSGPKCPPSLNDFGINSPNYYTYTYILELFLNSFKSVMPLLLQFPIYTPQYTYTHELFWD